MELDQFSTRRIEPDKPLWHFYLTRYNPPLLNILSPGHSAPFVHLFCWHSAVTAGSFGVNDRFFRLVL